MTEVDLEQIIQRGLDRFPGVSPRVISDNGPQFISKDFKEYVRLAGMTHVVPNTEINARLRFILGSLEHVFGIRLSRLAFVAPYRTLISVIGIRTSPFYPQSNGKIEALNKTVKKEVIRPCAPRSLEEAEKQIRSFVHHCNFTRLHSSVGYITPADKLAGKEAVKGS